MSWRMSASLSRMGLISSSHLLEDGCMKIKRMMDSKLILTRRLSAWVRQFSHDLAMAEGKKHFTFGRLQGAHAPLRFE